MFTSTVTWSHVHRVQSVELSLNFDGTSNQTTTQPPTTHNSVTFTWPANYTSTVDVHSFTTTIVIITTATGVVRPLPVSIGEDAAQCTT